MTVLVHPFVTLQVWNPQSLGLRSMHGETSSFWFHIQTPPNCWSIGVSKESLQWIWSAPNCLCAATYLVLRSQCTSLWPMSKLSLRLPIVQKIDRMSLAASVVVRTTTVTGCSVHTIQQKQITHREEVHHILLSLYWFPCIWLNQVAQLLCGSND